MLDATRQRGAITHPTATPDLTLPNGRSAPTRHSRANPGGSRSPAQQSLSHQHYSNRLRHSYHSSRVRVREWIDNDLGAREITQQISRMLNSNEQFRLDNSFSLHISHIRDPGWGAGNNRIYKGSMALDKLLNTKKSVVKITNEEELCCTRAIMTMKAYCDFGSPHTKYDS